MMAAPQISSVAGGGVTMQADASLQRSVYVKIIEEPASKALRFRYECEGRSAGSLPGATSTQDKKSFPKIQVHGHRGRAVVVVSCVTIDAPFRPHPHNLVGKEGCKKGVCTMEIANEDMTCEFSNLGIQCVKKKDIEDSLKVREEIRVDPFRTGFQHKTQPGSIDLNSVRLCFQVFLEGPERGQFKVPLKPVVSEPIYDKKAINDLTIMKLSDCTSPVMGGKEIILLCDKVSKDDIEIRFYEESEETGAIVWEGFGDFQPSDVHKQYAICFRTPQYNNLEITSPSRVYVQLRCPSKETTSAPRPFQYIPLLTSGTCKRKWNLLSFSSGAYSSYLTTSSPAPPANGLDLADGNSPKKHRPVQLEDILADEAKVDPIYDRLNEFMGIGKMSGRGDDNERDEDDAMERGEHMSAVVTEEDIYDVDLELISQIIRSQEEDGGQVGGGGGIGLELTGMEIDDLINGNGDGSLLVEQQVMMSAIQAGDTIILPQSDTLVPQTTQVTSTLLVEQQQPVPPTRPPKRQPADPAVQPPATQTQVSAPPLPPKKSTPKQSPTKQSPAAFLKNLLFSPTKKNKQKNNNTTNTTTTQQRVPPPAQSVDATAPPVPSTGPYELTENLALYVDNDAPLATASEFGDDDVVGVAQSGGGGAQGARDDPNQYYCSVVNNNQDTELKRKRQKLENCRNLSQYLTEHNKRPRQNSYPPVTPSPSTPMPQSPLAPPQAMSPLQPSPVVPSSSLYSQQPMQQLLGPPMNPPPSHQQQHQQQSLHQPVYVKQEPDTMSFQQQPHQYYDYMMQRLVQHHNILQPPPPQPLVGLYSGGGIIRDNNPEQENNNNNDQPLNSDFSLPNLSDVNLSLLDQHLSENLNDMNLNNF